MNDLIVALGSSIGGALVTQCLTWSVNRRKNKIDEVRIISEISTKLRQELFEESERQKKTIGILRSVIITLTGLLDEVFPRIHGITDDERGRLRAANIEARLAGLSVAV